MQMRLSDPQTNQRKQTQLSIAVSAALTLIWFAGMTGFDLWGRIADLWPASLTMVFGSIVAGSTPQGGGVVAFPVFTKVFGMPPEVARSFSFSIQSVGMSTAAAWIIINRRRVEWHAVVVVTSAAAIGLLGSSAFTLAEAQPFRPMPFPAPYVKVTFTIVLIAMAFVVCEVTRFHGQAMRATLPPMNARIYGMLIFCGLLGGFASGLVGSGADVLLYLAVVLFLGVDPKVGVPTSVICMAIISVVGMLHYGILDGQMMVSLDAAGHVVALNGQPVTLQEGRLIYGNGPGAPAEKYDLFGLWLACIPVVVWGAPIGTWIAARLSSRNLVAFVTVLALSEGVTTVIFLKSLRTDMVLLGYFLVGFVATIVVLRFIANRRGRIFRLPKPGHAPAIRENTVEVRDGALG